MTTQSQSTQSQSSTPALGRSTVNKVVVAVLAVVAVVAIIAGIMYFTEPAKSLPSVLGTITHPASRADSHRSLRAIVSLAFGVVCLVAAGLTFKMGKSSKS